MRRHDLSVEELVTDPEKRRRVHGGHTPGGVYGMAMIGAAVYYIRHATTVWAGLLGILKAIFWPAVLMYKVLELLKM